MSKRVETCQIVSKCVETCPDWTKSFQIVYLQLVYFTIFYNCFKAIWFLLSAFFNSSWFSAQNSAQKAYENRINFSRIYSTLWIKFLPENQHLQNIFPFQWLWQISFIHVEVTFRHVIPDLSVEILDAKNSLPELLWYFYFLSWDCPLCHCDILQYR